MNGSEHKELIEQIAETLRNHVEPYREGAWERFSTTLVKKKKPLLWPYWSAAATLLLAAGVWLWSRPEMEPIAARSEAAMKLPAPSGRGESAEAVTTPAPEIPAPAIQAGPAAAISGAHPSSAPHRTRSERDAARIASAESRAEDNGVPSDKLAEPEVGESVALEEHTGGVSDADRVRLALAEPLAKEEGEPHIDRQEYPEVRAAKDGSRGKWNLGIAVSPNVTRERMDFGGGLTVAYQLSDKLSVGSGVSIGRLGMGENPNYNPGGSSRLNNPASMEGFAQSREQYKRDVSLTSKVVALDVPLDFRYEVFKGVFTSVGVSYVAVLSEERTEHFIAGLNETTFGADKMAGKDLMASTTVTYRSEKTDDQPLKGKGYAGFMNFSVGRKMGLSKNVFLSIEPYFKLPIGRLSNEQMDFTNGGIRIVTGF